MLDQNPLKSHLFTTFVLLQTTEQNDLMHDIAVEVHHEIVMTKNTFHKIDTVLPLEIVLNMKNALLLHNTLVHDVTIIKETHDLIALSVDPHTNHLSDVTPVTDIDHAHTLEIIILHYTHPSFRPPSRPRDFLLFLDLAHTQIQEINLMQSNHKRNMIQLISKYICIIQHKWQTL